MSPEQTRQARASQQSLSSARAEARYITAYKTLALREADYLALDAIGAGAAAKLEALLAREKAATEVEHARRGVINAAWADGRLAGGLHLREAVEACLAVGAAQALLQNAAHDF